MRAIRFLVALVVAIVAGVAGASAVIGSTTPPAVVGPETLVPDGTGASVAATATDPAAGQARGGATMPLWGVRVYRSKTGLTCPDAGRVSGGDFGMVDDEGVFHALPLDASGSCADLTKGPFALVVRHYPATEERGAREVVFGAVAKDVTGVTLSVDGDDRALDVSSRAFVAPLAEDEKDRTTVTLTLADGQRIVQALHS